MKPKETKRNEPKVGDFVETSKGDVGDIESIFYSKNRGGVIVRYGMVNGNKYATSLLSVIPRMEELADHYIRLRANHLAKRRNEE